MSDPTATDPATHVMRKSEMLDLAFNFTKDLALLEPGAVIASAVSVLTDVTSDSSLRYETVALPDNPRVANPMVTQEVRGPSSLVAGHEYELAVTATIDADTAFTMAVRILVPGPPA